MNLVLTELIEDIREIGCSSEITLGTFGKYKEINVRPGILNK